MKHYLKHLHNSGLHGKTFMDGIVKMTLLLVIEVKCEPSVWPCWHFAARAQTNTD